MIAWQRTDDWKSEITGKNAEKRQRCLLDVTESGFDTMLNILWRSEEGEREEREHKHIIDYIISSLILIMNTEASIYREAMSDRQII